MAYQPLPPLGQDDMAGSLPVVVASDQSAIPVSGTVTANLSATDNAVLDAIEADTTTIAGDTTSIDAKIPALGQALAAASVPVVLTAAQITTLTPPTPQTDALTDTQLRATAVPVSVASIPTHAVTNAGTFAVQNTAATPAGTNNIGDVDVLTVNGVAPAFGSGVRGATVQRVTIATDDSVPVTGTFWQATQPVSLASVPSHAVTNAGTFATQESGALLTAAQLIDDAVHAEDAAHVSGDKGMLLLGVRDDGFTTFGVDGDYTPIATNYQGAVKVIAGESTGIVTRALTAADVVTANLSATDNAVLDTIDAVLDTIKTDTASIVTSVQTLDNAIAGSEMQVDIVSAPTLTVNAHAVTNAGTFVTQENGALLTAAQLIDDTVFADDAAVTLGTSKGNIVAGVAVNTDGTDPTAVSAEGDAAALRTDMNRLLIVNQTHPRFWHVSADYASAQTNVSVKAAPGASLSLYITDLQISNGATAGNVTLLDGSGGTVLYEVYPAINGGAVLSLRSPIKLTANTALCITSTTVTTHSIFVSGYIAA